MHFRGKDNKMNWYIVPTKKGHWSNKSYIKLRISAAAVIMEEFGRHSNLMKRVGAFQFGRSFHKIIF